MATKITQCPGCKSYNIKELNPDVKKTTMSIQSTIEVIITTQNIRKIRILN